MKTYNAIFRSNEGLDNFGVCTKIVKVNAVEGRKYGSSISYAYIRNALGGGYEYNISAYIERNNLCVCYNT